MEVVKGFSHNKNLSLALGFFDGVHLGHCCVIKNAVEYAKQTGIKSAIITFSNTPKNYFFNNKVPLLTSLETKLKKFEELDVDFVYLIDFDKNIANCSAQEYLEKYIIEYFKPQVITTGFNHTFGKDCSGSDFLEKNQKKYNFSYYKIPPITYDHCLISSSTIKKFISTSNFDETQKMLGYYFFVEGKVIKGEQIGRQINFPTANINYPENIVTFEEGAYVGCVVIKNKLFNGIFNYGTKPTVSSRNTKLLEFHIFDFNECIYDEKIKIIPLCKIRNEQKFNSVDELKNKLSNDKLFAKNFFENF